MRFIIQRWLNRFELIAEAAGTGDDEMRDRRLARLERELVALQSRMEQCRPPGLPSADRHSS